MQRLSLAECAAIVVGDSGAERERLAKLFKTWGAGAIECFALDEDLVARLRPRKNSIFIVGMDGGAGLTFVRDLRFEGAEMAQAPAIVRAESVRANELTRVRDSGAHAVVLKEMPPEALLARIHALARDKTAFITALSYRGPDRRWRFEGPPVETGERRALMALGDGDEDLSQSELDALITPRKVML